MSNVVEFSYSYRVKFKSKKRKEKVLVFYSRPPKIVALGRSCAMDVKEIHKQVFQIAKMVFCSLLHGLFYVLVAVVAVVF